MPARHSPVNVLSALLLVAFWPVPGHAEPDAVKALSVLTEIRALDEHCVTLTADEHVKLSDYVARAEVAAVKSVGAPAAASVRSAAAASGSSASCTEADKSYIRESFNAASGADRATGGAASAAPVVPGLQPPPPAAVPSAPQLVEAPPPPVTEPVPVPAKPAPQPKLAVAAAPVIAPEPPPAPGPVPAPAPLKPRLSAPVKSGKRVAAVTPPGSFQTGIVKKRAALPAPLPPAGLRGPIDPPPSPALAQAQAQAALPAILYPADWSSLYREVLWAKITSQRCRILNPGEQASLDSRVAVAKSRTLAADGASAVMNIELGLSRELGGVFCGRRVISRIRGAMTAASEFGIPTP